MNSSSVIPNVKPFWPTDYSSVTNQIVGPLVCLPVRPSFTSFSTVFFSFHNQVVSVRHTLLITTACIAYVKRQYHRLHKCVPPLQPQAADIGFVSGLVNYSFPFLFLINAWLLSSCICNYYLDFFFLHSHVLNVLVLDLILFLSSVRSLSLSSFSFLFPYLLSFVLVFIV